MSSELEKQFFIQREKPPEKPQVPSKVSPEKREEAIQYAREIRRIREKEILTEEDSARVEELAEKLKRIYSPEIQFESEQAKERLVELKQTPLWDEKRKQWNESMYENQEFQDSGRFSEVQLLGILAEAVTGNLEGIQERLEELKKTSLWDKEKEQWNWYMNENQELQNSDRFSYTQLLGVLAEAITGNLEGAKERLKELKKTSLWDKEREQWNWYINENQELVSSDHHSEAQLLGVLVEAITGNLEEAKGRLKKLKQTSLWDEEREQWNWYINENQEFVGSDRDSDAQLLGVLAEAITGNLEEVEGRLKKLKKTPLWDEKRKQWNDYMDKDQELESSIRYSNSQLLGVLVEVFHEKEEEFIEWLTKKK